VLVVQDSHPVFFPDGAEAGSSAAMSLRISTVPGPARREADRIINEQLRPRSPAEDRVPHTSSRRRDIEALTVQ
jgi:hypothetical protein